MSSTQAHSGSGSNFNAGRDLHVHQEHLEKHPTTLSEVINILSRSNEIAEDTAFVHNPFSIMQKLDHNKVQSYRDIFDEYKVFQGKLISLYNEFDRQGTTKKQFLLVNIRTHYLKAREKIVGSSRIEDIRNASDRIIQEVEATLTNEVLASNNIEAPKEAIVAGILVVMFDAFTQCKILERPNDNSSRN
jgi:hypothetical protein